jgi:hypothetical protein
MGIDCFDLHMRSLKAMGVELIFRRRRAGMS